MTHDPCIKEMIKAGHTESPSKILIRRWKNLPLTDGSVHKIRENTQSENQALIRIEWRRQVTFLESKSVFETKGIQVLQPGVSRKLHDPEIHICSNIGPDGYQLIVLVEELSQHRRIIICLIGCVISQINSG